MDVERLRVNIAARQNELDTSAALVLPRISTRSQDDPVTSCPSNPPCCPVIEFPCQRRGNLLSWNL